MVLYEEDCSKQGPEYGYNRNPEEQPLSVAGKSFSEMIEDQIQESSKPNNPEAKKVHPFNF